MGVDGRLRCVIKKQGVMLWYGFIRLTTGKSGEDLIISLPDE